MKSLKKTTILIVDDNTIVRQSLCSLLKPEGHLTVVGQARNGREGVKLARTLRPDVVLMDIAMPVLNGLEATREILAANPKAKVLMLSAHSDDAYIERMTAIGACGFIEKQKVSENLTDAIAAAVAGKRFFSPTIAKRMAHGKNWSRNPEGLLKPNGVRVTPRERKVLQLVAGKQTNRQIAAILSISVKAVGKHRQDAMDKLNIHETADLTHYAATHGRVGSDVTVTIF